MDNTKGTPGIIKWAEEFDEDELLEVLIPVGGGKAAQLKLTEDAVYGLIQHLNMTLAKLRNHKYAVKRLQFKNRTDIN